MVQFGYVELEVLVEYLSDDLYDKLKIKQGSPRAVTR